MHKSYTSHNSTLTYVGKTDKDKTLNQSNALKITDFEGA